MGAEAGEKCGFCATPQYEGASICRNCHAERRVEIDDSVGAKIGAFFGGLVGGFFLGLLASWMFGPLMFWLCFLGIPILAVVSDQTKVLWYR